VNDYSLFFTVQGLASIRLDKLIRKKIYEKLLNTKVQLFNKEVFKMQTAENCEIHWKKIIVRFFIFP